MKVTTSIKLDIDTKEQASILANELGLTLSSVINATLKKFVIERSIVLSVPPELNEQTKKKFLEMENDIKNNKNLSKTYSSVRELRQALEK